MMVKSCDKKKLIRNILNTVLDHCHQLNVVYDGEELIAKYFSENNIIVERTDVEYPKYIPTEDRILLKSTNVCNEEDLIELLHELCHSTGTQERLDRESFNAEQKYAFDEYVNDMNLVEEYTCEIASLVLLSLLNDTNQNMLKNLLNNFIACNPIPKIIYVRKMINQITAIIEYMLKN